MSVPKIWNDLLVSESIRNKKKAVQSFDNAIKDVYSNKFNSNILFRIITFNFIVIQLVLRNLKI